MAHVVGIRWGLKIAVRGECAFFRRFSRPALLQTTVLSLSRRLSVSAITCNTKAEGTENASLLQEVHHATDTFHPIDISSHGLGGYWPSGVVQSMLEGLYNYTHLPWWGCIVALTVAIRVAMTPVTVLKYRTLFKLALVGKESSAIHKRMTQYRASGEREKLEEEGVQLGDVYLRHDIYPLSSFTPVLIRAPIFLSVLYGIMGMTKSPVECMKTGGMLWFPDLVVPDPIFCLPLLNCAVYMFLNELAFWGEKQRLVLRIKWCAHICFVCITPFIMTFPAAVLVYTVTSGLYSMTEHFVFKLPRIRQLFNIPVSNS